MTDPITASSTTYFYSAGWWPTRSRTGWPVLASATIRNLTTFEGTVRGMTSSSRTGGVAATVSAIGRPGQAPKVAVFTPCGAGYLRTVIVIHIS
jgi:hypothetical protein